MTTYRTPWDPPRPDSPRLPSAPKRRGRRPRAASPPQPGAFRYFHLTVSGPAPDLAAFVDAAQGSGIVPWRHDTAELEEDVFLRAMSVPPPRRTLGLEGCRILARQFRDRVEAHHARAAARVGHSRACPLDLHALIPVPPAILQRGPADPAARAWLAEHWGVTDRLRHVARRPGGYSFFTDGETPAAAVAGLAARFPSLRFDLQHRAID